VISIKNFLSFKIFIAGNGSTTHHELAWATHCLVAVMKASGLKRPPSQTVHDLRPRAPEEATDLEMPSNCLTL